MKKGDAFLYAVTWHLSEFSKLLQYCCVTSRIFPGFAPVLSFSNSLRILKVFCSCVGLAERYVSHKELRPVKCSSDNDSFYISSNTAFGNKSTKWFKSQPVGINKISGFLKIISSKFYCMYNFCMEPGN
jgi:hypothetical protein